VFAAMPRHKENLIMCEFRDRGHAVLDRLDDASTTGPGKVGRR
jgi:hypothetical protein